MRRQDLEKASGWTRRAAGAVLLVLALVALPACTGPGALGFAAAPRASLAPAMDDGPEARAPQGWLHYCARNPQDLSCTAAAITPRRVEQLRAVQATLRRIPRRTDQQIFGAAEFWQVADLSHGGDCEDIALLARAQLLAAGWPRSSLRLATAWTERGEYHLVLTVDVVADEKVETLVLDSRFAQVQSYARLRSVGYRFETRQAATGAGWVKIAAPTLAEARNASPAGASMHVRAAASFSQDVSAKLPVG